MLDPKIYGTQASEALSTKIGSEMIISTHELKWHVLLVKPRSEKKVEKKLKDIGFEACVPTQKQIRQWSDRKKVIDKVLFNNYVFVASTSAQHKIIIQLENVIKYISFGGQIATLSEHDVALIKKLNNLSSSIHINYHTLQLGNLVEIRNGCLKGYKGHIVFINGSSRIQLKITDLQCFACVELKEWEVMKVEGNGC